MKSPTRPSRSRRWPRRRSWGTRGRRSPRVNPLSWRMKRSNLPESPRSPLRLRRPATTARPSLRSEAKRSRRTAENTSAPVAARDDEVPALPACHAAGRQVVFCPWCGGRLIPFACPRCQHRARLGVAPLHHLWHIGQRPLPFHVSAPLHGRPYRHRIPLRSPHRIRQRSAEPSRISPPPISGAIAAKAGHQRAGSG